MDSRLRGNDNEMTIKKFIRSLAPKFLLSWYHFGLAFLGAVINGFPSKDLIVIGVTGTSGKSTTVDLISRILSESGAIVASTSTARFKIGGNEWENKYKMTMPGRFVIQNFLKRAKKEGAKYVVLEVTSEGIRQFRHKFINFDCAVFTNLTPEHIESHGGFENYRKAKLELFKATKRGHIINVNDENAKYFWEIPAKAKWGFGLKNRDIKAEINNKGQVSELLMAENVSVGNATSFEVKGKKVNLNLFGEFNALNAMAAICAGLFYGVDLEVCKKALEKAKSIPGRMEVVGEKPTVIVDYAHTPEQLENVYKTFSGENLVCVLGSCGGGRDKWKRPVLGEIASKYCSRIILTNEDPYDENPEEIVEQVKSGITKEKLHVTSKVMDRKEAIGKAIKEAKQNDLVLITGKGSEPWLCVADGKKIPWSDKKFAEEFLNKK